MIRVNLLKSERKAVEEKAAPAEAKRRKGPGGELVLLLVVVAMGGLVVVQRQAESKEKRLLAAAQEEYAQLEPVVAKLEEVGRRRVLLRQKIDLISRLQAQQPVPIEILEEISRSLPEWVWLSEAGLKNGVLQIKGRALSNVLLSDYIAALERSDVLDAVSLISSTQVTAANTQILEFALQANVIVGPAPGTPAAGAGSAEGR